MPWELDVLALAPRASIRERSVRNKLIVVMLPDLGERNYLGQ
jgi:hypothetical protein